MYKMIVIDDEYLVRVGIKETINWKNYNIEIIASGNNGQQGLELALKYNPDIIISDIRMPIMDGLDLVKEIKKNKLDTVIVMLSGYKDFEYAKETLENGAYLYLLKPIDNNKLVESVLKAIEHLEEERKKKKQLKHIENDLPLITNTIIQSILIPNTLNFSEIKEKIKDYNINIKEKGYVTFFQIENSNNLNKMKNIIEKNIPNCNYIAFSTHIVALISDITKDNLITKLNLIITEYENQTQSNIYIGLSDEYFQIEKINEAYICAKNNVNKRSVVALSSIFTNDDIKLNYHKIVVDGLKYIAKNYQKNISISSCAFYLNVSESHLMHLFKEETGKTFNECLTEQRMKIAEKLLATRQYKIYEISDKVGYNDTKYFSQVFKKTYGVTPYEYISNLE